MTTKPAAEHCTFADIGTAADDTPADVLAVLSNYFSAFAKPVRTEDGYQLCISCGKRLTGMMAAFMGGGFEWGIAHGEGHCANCRWPGRAHHFIHDDKSDEPLITIHNMVLQYHPDFVDQRQTEAA